MGHEIERDLNMAATKERRKGYGDILVAIAEIKKDTGQIFTRLDKINGYVQEYVENRHKMNDNKIAIEKLEDDLEKNIKPPLTKLTIKIYSTAILAGLFSGGIGTLIGFYISKLTGLIGG